MLFRSDPNLQKIALPSVVGIVAEGVMAVCGLAAGIGILMKKPWAMLPGWIAAGMDVLSIGINLLTTWQSLIQGGALFQGPQGDAARVGAYVGLVGVVVFRLVILGCYTSALLMYSKWVAARAE